MIHGSFTVLFNLYLLAVGFDVRFIGLRLMIGFIASAVTAMPAGIVSDRIGRKASFILGDGIGAVIALIMISSRNEAILLAGPALVAFFNNLHHTSEAAFMMENSKGSERVHLFSVSASFRTLSSMAGALIAGLVPLMFIDDIGKVDAYRYATYAGLSLWFISLVPALMLRSKEAEEHPEQGTVSSSPSTKRAGGLKSLLADIHHPRRIAYFVLTSAFISLAAGTVVPLLNIAYHEGPTHAGEAQLGGIFAGGELGVALASLAIPLLAARMLKVDAIALTRMLSLPFVLALGFIPLFMSEGAFLVALVGLSHFGRSTIFRMTMPLDDAFNMEVLEPRERATSTGIEIATGAAISAGAIYVGSRLMASGDFMLPFMIMAAGYLVSTVIYWKVFRPLESSLRAADEPGVEPLVERVTAD